MVAPVDLLSRFDVVVRLRFELWLNDACFAIVVLGWRMSVFLLLRPRLQASNDTYDNGSGKHGEWRGEFDEHLESKPTFNWVELKAWNQTGSITE